MCYYNYRWNPASVVRTTGFADQHLPHLNFTNFTSFQSGYWLTDCFCIVGHDDSELSSTNCSIGMNSLTIIITRSNTDDVKFGFHQMSL